MDEYEFTPWVTPLHAVLYRGPFPVGGVLVYGPDEDACRVGREVSLRFFFGLTGVRDTRERM